MLAARATSPIDSRQRTAMIARFHVGKRLNRRYCHNPNQAKPAVTNIHGKGEHGGSFMTLDQGP